MVVGDSLIRNVNWLETFVPSKQRAVYTIISAIYHHNKSMSKCSSILQMVKRGRCICAAAMLSHWMCMDQSPGRPEPEETIREAYLPNVIRASQPPWSDGSGTRHVRMSGSGPGPPFSDQPRVNDQRFPSRQRDQKYVRTLRCAMHAALHRLSLPCGARVVATTTHLSGIPARDPRSRACKGARRDVRWTVSCPCIIDLPFGPRVLCTSWRSPPTSRPNDRRWCSFARELLGQSVGSLCFGGQWYQGEVTHCQSVTIYASAATCRLQSSLRLSWLLWRVQ
jgi:hypothetical protein